MFLHQVCSMQRARVFPPLLPHLHVQLLSSHLVLHWPRVPLSCQSKSYLFQSSRNNACFFYWKIPCKTCKTFCFLFHQSAAICTFPRFLKLRCFLDWSCSRHCRCCVTLSILLSSEESVQWALNCERKYNHIVETWKAVILNPTMHFISE